MSLESVVLQAKAVTATWTPRVGFWAMVMPDGTVDYVDRKIGCIRHAEKHFGTRKVRFIRDA